MGAVGPDPCVDPGPDGASPGPGALGAFPAQSTGRPAPSDMPRLGRLIVLRLATTRPPSRLPAQRRRRGPDAVRLPSAQPLLGPLEGAPGVGPPPPRRAPPPRVPRPRRQGRVGLCAAALGSAARGRLVGGKRAADVASMRGRTRPPPPPPLCKRKPSDPRQG